MDTVTISMIATMMMTMIAAMVTGIMTMGITAIRTTTAMSFGDGTGRITTTSRQA
jgi:hypothetical protein